MCTAALQWLLMALFSLRVLGQLLVELAQVRFLPPSEEWMSGLIPYPMLVASQAAILLLMAKIGMDFTRQSGWTYRPSRRAGRVLWIFGLVYLAVMVIRYVVRMALYEHERWTGGSIPIFFHWILAAYVLVLAHHHWTRGERPAATPNGPARRWLARLAWLGGATTLAAALAAWTTYLLLPSLLAMRLGIRRPEYAVRIERRVELATSDGVRLAADVYHPQRAGPKIPTILVRLPYSKTAMNTAMATLTGKMWAERGYTVVIQGTRGRYESGGTYYPLRHEREDGLQTLRWLAEQPWYDGRVGMWGGSYFGYTQWVLADCGEASPTALLIQEASSDFHGMFYPGGAFSLQTALYWSVMSHGPRDVVPSRDAINRGLRGWPPLQSDDRAAGQIPFFDDWALHPERDAFWAAIDGSQRPRRIQSPVLLMAGWYDPFLPTQLRDFMTIRRGAEARVADESRLVIGPWTHAQTVEFPDGASPRNYRLECLAPSVTWFDRHLKGDREAPMPPVRIYVMGLHQWRDETEWPLARTRYTPLYLHSQGQAQSAAGDGALVHDEPETAEPADHFAYDPENPVPSRGGAMLGPDAGILRQIELEARGDVLVYTTAPLAQNLEITGPLELVLFVSTSAPCTDFTAKLVDVWPDGSAYNVSEGILRREYVPGAITPTEIRIELWPTSTVFLTGHRLRLEVSSSSYPRFDRNPNTGLPIARETKSVVAHQSVHHGRGFPSRLILPVIP